MAKAKTATEDHAGKTVDGEETQLVGTEEKVTGAGMGIPRNQPTVDDPKKKTDANTILGTDPRV